MAKTVAICPGNGEVECKKGEGKSADEIDLEEVAP